MAKNTITPIIDKERRHETWHKQDIYTGEENSTGRYVPNVDDLVYDFSTGYWRCVHVDYNTGYSTLVPWNLMQLSGGITNNDVIIGGGNGIGSEHYRIYVNTKVVPYEFSIDVRLRIYGSEASYIKIFKENEVHGTAISAEFNSRGVMVGENIQLENVVIPNTQVTAIKTPKQGHLTEKLADGEVVSVVVYSNSGAVLSIFKLVVVNTNFVRTIDAGKKLITDITLISPYLNTTDRTLLEYPSNMIIDSAGLVAKVTYNDGSEQRHNIGNGKFELHGTENYVSSQLGQTIPLVLSYKLARDEYSNNVKQVGNERFINKAYRLLTVDSDSMYDVKLFIVPWWSRTTKQWNLKYYLGNLDRDYLYDVTQHVEYGVNSVSFDGSNAKWGTAQRLTVALNLDKVASTFNVYRHVTDFTITLMQAGENPAPNGYYVLAYDNDSIVREITTALFRQTGGNVFEVDVTGGLATTTDWLREVYLALDPLRYSFIEPEPPSPTHVKVYVGDKWSKEFLLRDIIHKFKVSGVGGDIKAGDLIRLEFVHNSASKRMLLGTIGLVAKLIQ